MLLFRAVVPLYLVSWVDSEPVCLACHHCAKFRVGGAVLSPMPTRHTPKSTPDMIAKVPTVPIPYVMRAERRPTNALRLVASDTPLFVADTTRSVPGLRMFHTLLFLFQASLRAFHTQGQQQTDVMTPIVAPTARSTRTNHLSIATSHSHRLPRSHTPPHTLPTPSLCFRSR